MKQREIKPKSNPNLFFTVIVFLTVIFIFLYLVVRTVLFFTSPFLWYEKLFAFVLLTAEIFILTHSLGYFLNLYHILRNPGKSFREMYKPKDLTNYPPVAIIVSSYKEPLEVVEDTLICFYNLTYPNKHLYFLDDTRYDLPGRDADAMEKYKKDIDDLCRRIGINLFRRKWHGAKAGMINDFLDFIEGKENKDFHFHPYSDGKRREKEKYIIVFDADMNPFPDFVEQLVSVMEQNPKTAFVQTPQYYSNFYKNRVARASGLQQVIFYEYICEGKSLQDAMFCCGTNVIFRREALIDVGGFDESSVTEDFATSLKFHSNKWSSAYFNKVCAFGMGPEDLGGYFKQQFRWSIGTVGLFRTIAAGFIKDPKQLSPNRWWEYFLSGSHYFVGWVIFVLTMSPLLYLFFSTPSFFAEPEIYFFFFAPYIILSTTVFISSLRQRGYKYRDLFQGIILNALSFPVFMKASFLAVIGVRGTFGITPKGGSSALPMTSLFPQLAVAVLSFTGVLWGILRIHYEEEPLGALVVNTFWSLYHFIIFSFVLYFNNPEEE